MCFYSKYKVRLLGLYIVHGVQEVLVESECLCLCVCRWLGHILFSLLKTSILLMAAIMNQLSSESMAVHWTEINAFCSTRFCSANTSDFITCGPDHCHSIKQRLQVFSWAPPSLPRSSTSWMCGDLRRWHSFCHLYFYLQYVHGTLHKRCWLFLWFVLVSTPPLPRNTAPHFGCGRMPMILPTSCTSLLQSDWRLKLVSAYKLIISHELLQSIVSWQCNWNSLGHFVLLLLWFFCVFGWKKLD